MDNLTVELRKDGVVVLLGGTPIPDIDSLRARAGDVPADALAQAVAVLGPPGYAVITNPDAFAAAYRARLATEDPTQPWRPGVMRLRDFGTPDFDAITPPRRDGDRLVFFAQDTFSGLPYRMDLTLSGAEAPVYQPMALAPMPDPSPAVPETVTRAAVGPQAPVNPRVPARGAKPGADPEDDDISDEADSADP